MRNLKISFFIIIALFMMIPHAFSQAAEKAYYVCSSGDDEKNNGRTQETAFKTLPKAIEMASNGIIKRINIIGKVPASIEIFDTGSEEILITGKNSENEKAMLTQGKAFKSIIYVGENVKLRFENIEISGSREVTYGGGLRIDGVVTLGNGSVVCDNQSYQEGAGIYLGNRDLGGGTCILAGGEISNNVTKNQGAGIYVGSTGTFIIENGKITQNTCEEGTDRETGAGVYVGDNGTFIMKGGEILENKAYTNGGGISVNFTYGGKFLISGGTIKGNHAKIGGGIYLSSTKGSMAISGGEILNNEAEYGAGIYLLGNLNLEKAIVTENNAAFVGGGIYIKKGSLTNTKGSIINNKAGDGGEDIYKVQ